MSHPHDIGFRPVCSWDGNTSGRESAALVDCDYCSPYSRHTFVVPSSNLRHDFCSPYSRHIFVIPSSYLRHTFVIPSSYLHHTFLIPSSYLRHTFGVPSKYLRRTFVMPCSFLRHTFVIHLSYIRHTHRLMHLSFTWPRLTKHYNSHEKGDLVTVAVYALTSGS